MRGDWSRILYGLLSYVPGASAPAAKKPEQTAPPKLLAVAPPCPAPEHTQARSGEGRDREGERLMPAE